MRLTRRQALSTLAISLAPNTVLAEEVVARSISPSFGAQLTALFKGEFTPDEIARCEALGAELLALGHKINEIDDSLAEESRTWPDGDSPAGQMWYPDVEAVWNPTPFEDHPVQRHVALEAIRRYEAEGIYERLERVIEAPATPKWKQWPSWFSLEFMEYLGPSRQLSRAARARMHLAVERGDIGTAVSAFRIPLRLAGANTRPTAFFIDQLVSISLTALGVEAARDLAMRLPGSPRLLRAVAESLDKELLLPNAGTFFDGERLYALAWPQFNGEFSDSPWSAAGFVDRVTEYYAIGNRRAMMSRRERLADPFDEEAWCREHRRWWSRLDASLEDLAPIDRSLRSLDQERCDSGGVRLLLAIEIYRAERGVLPDSFADLVPEYIAALPTDPYAPDGRLRFKRIDPATDPHGRDYLVYSVGADGTDDGGTPAPGDEWQSPQDAISGQCKNCDFIINQR